jgi:hypothetical protein
MAVRRHEVIEPGRHAPDREHGVAGGRRWIGECGAPIGSAFHAPAGDRERPGGEPGGEGLDQATASTSSLLMSGC